VIETKRTKVPNIWIRNDNVVESVLKSSKKKQEKQTTAMENKKFSGIGAKQTKSKRDTRKRLTPSGN
jgi:hypothetical protein